MAFPVLTLLMDALWVYAENRGRKWYFSPLNIISVIRMEVDKSAGIVNVEYSFYLSSRIVVNHFYLVLIKFFTGKRLPSSIHEVQTDKYHSIRLQHLPDSS